MQLLIILSLEEEITLSAMAFRRDFFELSTVKNTLIFEVICTPKNRMTPK